ncbi:MAG: potassium channel family protein [Bacillota bacterium]
MYIVIIGSGRTGSKLASVLSKNGHEVVVIDKNDNKFSKLSVEFSGFTVEGDALEYEILRKAKLDKADIAVVTTDNDKVNYMLAHMARDIFNVNKTLVRVIDPKREKMLVDVDNVETFSPISLLVEAFENKIKKVEG